jgi:hypothetical protein
VLHRAGDGHPCIDRRVDDAPTITACVRVDPPAAWSFLLALRAVASAPPGRRCTWLAKGCREALGIDTVTQVALFPVAYTIGDEFKPLRPPVETITFWDEWERPVQRHEARFIVSPWAKG